MEQDLYQRVDHHALKPPHALLLRPQVVQTPVEMIIVIMCWDVGEIICAMEYIRITLWKIVLKHAPFVIKEILLGERQIIKTSVLYV